jgi:AraC-like DNA-binding protein
MKFTLTTQNVLELAAEKGLWSASPEAEGQSYRQTCLQLPGMKVLYKESLFDKFNILQGHYNVGADLEWTDKSEISTIEMQFNLEYAIPFGLKGQKELLAPALHHNVLYYPQCEGYVQFGSGRQYRTFDIHLAPAFLLQWQGHSKTLDAFLEKVQRQVPTRLYPGYKPVTTAMQTIIYEIEHFNYADAIKRVFTEAKVMELFALQLHVAENMGDSREQLQGLKPKDIELIHEVREYIHNNLDAPCSIITLAHKVGTNDFKLKKGFKELFGTTVFGYMQQVRMEEARRILLHTDRSVSDIAETVGYSNISNFTNAFKKHFGCSPRGLRA